MGKITVPPPHEIACRMNELDGTGTTLQVTLWPKIIILGGQALLPKEIGTQFAETTKNTKVSPLRKKWLHDMVLNYIEVIFSQENQEIRDQIRNAFLAELELDRK